MYLINITIKLDKIKEDEKEKMLEEHRKWFAKYFDKGIFIIVGPYLDKAGAGVIITHIDSREKLDKILEEDSYYPENLADYEIREFKANMVADNIKDFQGK